MKILHSSKLTFPDDSSFEVVERKGMGHPDTLADGIAEKISIEYSKYCLQNFGAILHHNVDKVCVMGGLAKVDWSYGEFQEPLRVLVNGRMSTSYGSISIPIEDIQDKCIREYVGKILPRMDIEKWLKIIHETSSSSRNPKWFHPDSIEDLPEYSRRFANDTSAVVGHWPLSLCERLTLILEGYFYDVNSNPKFNYIGQDIKVMIVRKAKHLDITMCIPFFSQDLADYDEYKNKKDFVHKQLTKLLNKEIPSEFTYDLYINTQDQNAKDLTSVKKFYFVAGGSSTDFGEEGVVGRGNNRRGFIPSIRPYTMEAAWGKNPVYHVGKVYGYIVDTLARTISEKYECKAEVWVITRMGDPFFDPYNLLINTSLDISKDELTETVNTILNTRDWTERIINDEILLPKPNNY